jgi:ATP-dependent Zn protease
MEKKSKAHQIYVYAVSVVVIITVIICFIDLLNSIIDASSPLLAWGEDRNLSSFQNFKMDALKSGQLNPDYIPDDDTFRQMYEDAKNNKIAKVKHQSTKSIIVNSIIIVFCLVLFVVHWVWMKRMNKKLGIT